MTLLAGDIQPKDYNEDLLAIYEEAHVDDIEEMLKRLKYIYINTNDVLVEKDGNLTLDKEKVLAYLYNHYFSPEMLESKEQENDKQ